MSKNDKRCHICSMFSRTFESLRLLSIFQAVDAEKLSRRLRLSKAALSHIVELLFARITTERANTVGI